MAGDSVKLDLKSKANNRDGTFCGGSYMINGDKLITFGGVGNAVAILMNSDLHLGNSKKCTQSSCNRVVIKMLKITIACLMLIQQ